MDYKNYHNVVISMQRRMRDYLDDKSHSQAGQLEKAFQRLEDDVQVQKNVNTIRDDLKGIESVLNSMDESVMSHSHIDELEDWILDSLQKIR
jgi:hypothetical protein